MAWTHKKGDLSFIKIGDVALKYSLVILMEVELETPTETQGRWNRKALGEILAPLPGYPARDTLGIGSYCCCSLLPCPCSHWQE